jgi:hypothetical protein
MAALLHRVPVLSAEESVRVADAVHALRPHWKQRHDTPFFTLGTAAYMDARDGQFATYQAQSVASNVMLREHFGWLLERFRDRVSEQVGDEVVYHPGLALPGFHIFLFDEAFRKSGASVHYDKQFEHIDWTTIGTPDTDAQLSLTLSVKLPAGGGGLLVWNINRIEIEKMPQAHTRAPTAWRRSNHTRSALSPSTPVTSCTRSARLHTCSPATNASRCRPTHSR